MPINIFWMRRDLRLEDNAALYHALSSKFPVQIIFIFDTSILGQLSDSKDARVDFIFQEVANLNDSVKKYGSSIMLKYGNPLEVWESLLKEQQINEVYFNEDYEPKTRDRDNKIAKLLKSKGINFNSFKDHVVFHKNEICKADGTPYTVFTPYFNKWKQRINEGKINSFPSESNLSNLAKSTQESPLSLKDLGFEPSNQIFPDRAYQHRLAEYEKYRDYPAKDATSKIGLHLRFGTLSIRQALHVAVNENFDKWLSELAWRDFYSMILWHFPNIENQSFKEKFRFIKWLNNEKDFEKWCSGNTGYPLVDAGMRQLNATGYMHNRVRMVTASFLCKHLLIDWKWGEVYFASKLLDYDLASNVGGWQWAASTGNDAVPYFRIFNPQTQLEKFDPKLEYVKKWIPEYGTKKYAQPMVEHTFARNRALNAYVVGAGTTVSSTTS